MGKIIGNIVNGVNSFRAARKSAAVTKRKALVNETKTRMKNIREGNPHKNLGLDKY